MADKLRIENQLQDMPCISVILPVYNREDLIGNAIESVINQTEKDWELIIVDDGSTDSTGIICDEYAQKDLRIHVLHTENQGVSAARNIGLLEARGNWVAFLDSDDIYFPNAFYTMLANSEGMDLVAVSMQYLGSGINRYLVREKKLYKTWFKTFEQDVHTLWAGCFYSSVFAKIYRRKTITDVFNHELSYGEDILFNLSIMPSLKEICILPFIGYGYLYKLGESHGQKAELMQLEVQRDILMRWKNCLYPRYMDQLSIMFQRYIEFVLKFIIKVLRSESLPLMYRQAILSAQLDSIIVDESEFGFDGLPAGHQRVWKLLQERDVEKIFASLSSLESECFEKPLGIYQKDENGQYNAVSD